MSARDETPPAAGDLFRTLLFAPDREDCPGANPVLSWREDDDPSYLEEIERYGIGHYELERRGAWHGRWSELEGAKLLPKTPRGKVFHAALQRRWHAAEPVALRRVLGDGWRNVRELADERVRMHRRWNASKSVADDLRADLGRVLERQKRFTLGGDSSRALEAGDPARDLVKLDVLDRERPDAGLWVKLARLSTYDGDTSLRLRVSFGAEVAEDASTDEERHGRVRDLAQHLLSETRSIASEREFVERIDRLCGCATTFTQHIAYWNGPGGGALFHHDAFDQDPAERQLGVAYVQLAGRTAWLALSIERLAERVAEFLELLAEGELPWVRDALFADAQLEELRAQLDTCDALTAELALPGCGRLAQLVNHGPEFTSLLADAGHAFVLRPGDAILLPNHGLASTAMHSVFCASPEVTYGVSLAVRRRSGH